MTIRDTFGGKADGLVWLVENSDLGYIVPEFEMLDFSFYIDSYKNETFTPSDALLKKVDYIVDKFKGQEIIIRSSSKKEDGKNSFSGIYESINIDKVTKKTVLGAIGKVYSSVDSTKAKNYRLEHNIEDDLMGLIIQKYISEPEFSGVVFTSNPTYPDDMSIEFSKGAGGVVSRNDKSERSYIVDIYKKTGKKVFVSERYLDILGHSGYELIGNELFNICKAIEDRNMPSDIEFSIKNKKIYLFQKREITDICEIKEVNIPEYAEDKGIGSTNIVRGTGKITLPIVKMSDFGRFITRPEMMMLNVNNKEAYRVAERVFFEKLKLQNEKYPKGYIFLTDEFGDTTSKYAGEVSGTNTSTDFLTSNKKAVITTNDSSLYSHIMTIAREREE